MGLFSRTKERGMVAIRFSGENETHVQTATLEDNWVTEVLLFCWYYARMLTNLGEADDVALTLLQTVDSLANQALNSEPAEPSVLPDEITLSKEMLDTPTRMYVGTLYEKGEGTFIMNTEVTPGGEGWYAPISVLALLQHTLDRFQPPQQKVLWLSICGMHEYYAERGWTGLPSINEAPSAGFAFMKQSVASDGAR